MRKSMMMAGVFFYFYAAGVAQAGPLIAAQSVSRMCQVQGATVLSVSVVLNGTTSNFYGTTLWYHFIPVAGGGSGNGMHSFPSPSPSANPVKLAVPVGAYNLIIANNQTLTPSASQSPQYPVTVPSNLTVSFGQKKICNSLISPPTRLEPPRVRG